MGASAAIMMGANAIGTAYSQSAAMSAQGKYQKTMADINARLSNAQAEEAIQRGEAEAQKQRRKTRQIAGTQAANMAAQGIDIGSGNALQLLEETYRFGGEDALTIKNNAYREAFGYRIQGMNQAGQGRFDLLSSRFGSRQTLLSGGMQAAGYFADAGGKLKKSDSGSEGKK